ncbi:hypothetical protein AGMMS49940_22670 [Spirochaetia bacterium]|nr:hypothetical protein AGMMS49940_22670 [Spirochaetia bacterium]
MDLNGAIQLGTADIAAGLPEGAKIAVLNIAGAPTEALANYMLNEVVEALVNTGKFTLLDRDKTNKAMINTEIGYQQITGEVNEDNQVRIGENLGAQIIITCMLEDMGEYFRLRLRSLEIQSRKMIASKSVNISSNELAKLPEVPRSLWEPLVLMASVYAPHLGEELWEKLGHCGSVSKAAWPAWDDTLTADNEVTVVAQVNGKIRDKFTAAAGTPKEALEKTALALPGVLKWTGGQTIVKVITVPDKLVNIVVK